MPEIQKELIGRRTANSKTFDLGNGRRRLIAHIGDVHYKNNYADPSEQWKDIDLTWEENRITKAPYELTHEGNKLTLRNKRTGNITTIELLDIGGLKIPNVAWERSKGLARAPGIATIDNVALDTDLEVIAEFSAVKFRRVLKSDKAPQEAKYRVTGDTSLVAVRASDEEGDIPIETSLKESILTETLKPDRIVKYPVKIDPTWQVGASTDDCFRRLIPPAFSLIDTSQIAGYYNRDLYEEGGGMRFTNITIPQGATIDSAYLTLKSTGVYTATTVKSRISAEGVDDAVTFADDAAAFDTRWAARTTARVDWDIPTAWYNDVEYDSPEINIVIKEIVDRGGWGSGNAIVIFWEDFDNRSSKVSNCHRRADSYDGSTTYAPKLVIDYTVPVVAPTVTTQAVNNIGIATADGHGTIVDTGGENCSKRGVCWNTTGNPTVANSKSEETDSFGTGAFTRPMAGLTPGQHYYVKAYAYNSEGYGYGGQVEFTTKALITGSAFGSGIGLGSATGEIVIIAVEGIGAGSGIGTATAQGILDVIAQAQGSGVGEATAQAILDILAEADGSGVGLGTTEALIKVLAAAAASGEGLGEAEALLEVIAEATGSGIGEGQGQSYIIVFASGQGSGIGLGAGLGILVKLGLASGLGIGLSEATAYLVIPASASGEGIGTTSIEALVDILAQATGSGIGEAVTQGLAIVVLTSEEFATLQARISGLESTIAELELELEPKARFRI